MRIRSLKKFLITNIGISVILISLIALSSGYFAVNHHTSRFFDILLVETAKKIRVFIKAELTPDQLEDIQEELTLCTSDYNKANKLYKPCELNSQYAKLQSWSRQFTDDYEADSIFQIWQAKPKKLLVHSLYAPNEQFAPFIPGFTDVSYQKENLRVYTQINPEFNLIIQAAQNYEMRNHLSSLVLKEYIWPSAFLLPIMLIIILITIKIAIENLQRLSDAIKKRDPKNLDHLQLDEAPLEAKPLIEVINRLFRRIKHSFKREQRFNSDAAHELKTPLAAIKAQAEVANINLNNLENSEIKSNLKNSLNNIINGINRSDHVISQLLLLSRLSPDEPLQDLEPCKLDQITREIIAELIPKASHKNIDISLEIINKFKVPEIIVNKVLINVLIKNIIDNAIKYCPDDSKIEVIISKSYNRRICLQIADNGPGLSNDKKARMFDRFYREPGSLAEGSGLGLSIVKLIAELHNAEIEVSDNTDEKSGLVFKVFFRS